MSGPVGRVNGSGSWSGSRFAVDCQLESLDMALVSQGELIGLLNLGPRRSEQEYNADDRRLLANLATQAAETKLVGAVEVPGLATIGRDAGEIAGVGVLHVPIVDSLDKCIRPDAVTLDFTNSAAAVAHLRTAVRHQAPIVIGSTGYTPPEQAERSFWRKPVPVKDKVFELEADTIIAAIGQIYFDKLGNSTEKFYYRPHVRDESRARTDMVRITMPTFCCCTNTLTRKRLPSAETYEKSMSCPLPNCSRCEFDRISVT